MGDPIIYPAIKMDCDNRLSDWESHTKFYLRENKSKVEKQYEVGDASCKII